MAIGGSALPWADPALFAELMLCWELRSHRMAAGMSCRKPIPLPPPAPSGPDRESRPAPWECGPGPQGPVVVVAAGG
jgi:hypothetical protein